MTRHLAGRCANCATTETSQWRRNKFGERNCNACALSINKHGINSKRWSANFDGNIKRDMVIKQTRNNNYDLNVLNKLCRKDLERKSAALGAKNLNQLIQSKFKIY
jgi:hypothetical protein